jgi:hypothetical protein
MSTAPVHSASAAAGAPALVSNAIGDLTAALAALSGSSPAGTTTRAAAATTTRAAAAATTTVAAVPKPPSVPAIFASGGVTSMPASGANTLVTSNAANTSFNIVRNTGSAVETVTTKNGMPPPVVSLIFTVPNPITVGDHYIGMTSTDFANPAIPANLKDPNSTGTNFFGWHFTAVGGKAYYSLIANGNRFDAAPNPLLPGQTTTMVNGKKFYSYAAGATFSTTRYDQNRVMQCYHNKQQLAGVPYTLDGGKYYMVAVLGQGPVSFSNVTLAGLSPGDMMAFAGSLPMQQGGRRRRNNSRKRSNKRGGKRGSRRS